MNGTFDNTFMSHLNQNKIEKSFPNNFDNNTEFSLFRLTVYNISVEGQYDLLGNIGDLFDVFGNGNFW